MLLQLGLNLHLHLLVGVAVIVIRRETKVQALGDIPRTEVRGHDDDGVLEVDLTALGVGQTTLFENLQQRVEDVGVSLLDLVEEHNGERLATHLLSELATLFVTDEAGGRAE